MRAARPLEDGLQPSASGESAAMATCTSAGAERVPPSWPGCSRRRRRGSAARAAIPSRNSGREAVERLLRDTERLQTLVGERDRDPGVVRGIGRRPSGVDQREQPSHQLAAGGPVVDAQQEVRPDVRRGPLVQRPALDVVELEATRRVGSVRCRASMSVVVRGAGAGPGSAAPGRGTSGTPVGSKLVDAVADGRARCRR